MQPRNPPLKKRQRTAAPSSTSSSSVNATIDPSIPPPPPFPSPVSLTPRPRDRLFLVPVPGRFNDASSADILLHLYVEDAPDNDNARIYLHSPTLRRARYFDALLSDRWSNDGEKGGRVVKTVNYEVCVGTGTVRDHVSVIKLLYEGDEGLEGGIFDVGTAVRYLPIAVKLLFEDCVRRCVRLIEAVPWSEEEEVIVALVPFLSEDESREILARVSLSRRVDDDDGEGEGEGLCERMLSDLLVSAKQNNCSNVAQVKAFVARLLREFSSRESARRVLEDAFLASLKVVKGSLEEYSSPDFRGDHNETEAIQRLNLHNALTNGKHLLWIIERMIELRVADMAVNEWSEQASFSADLQRAFRDDAWRNIVPGLPTVVLKCTSKLANAVASGTILVARQVRMKFVKDWLPVLIVCKDNSSPVLPSHKPVLHSPTSLYLELEETFLRIISTLPMDDAQELLQQCLSFSTRDSDDCPHLLTAFHTWFRRATRS